MNEEQRQEREALLHYWRHLRSACEQTLDAVESRFLDADAAGAATDVVSPDNPFALIILRIDDHVARLEITEVIRNFLRSVMGGGPRFAFKFESSTDDVKMEDRNN